MYEHVDSARHFRMYLSLFFWGGLSALQAQSAGNAGTINGTVTDATGAIVPGATVSIRNPVSGYERTATADSAGQLSIHESTARISTTWSYPWLALLRLSAM